MWDSKQSSPSYWRHTNNSVCCALARVIVAVLFSGMGREADNVQHNRVATISKLLKNRMLRHSVHAFVIRRLVLMPTNEIAIRAIRKTKKIPEPGANLQIQQPHQAIGEFHDRILQDQEAHLKCVCAVQAANHRNSRIRHWGRSQSRSGISGESTLSQHRASGVVRRR